MRLVERELLLGLSLGDVLLGLVETGEGQPDPAQGDAFSAAGGGAPGAPAADAGRAGRARAAARRLLAPGPHGPGHGPLGRDPTRGEGALLQLYRIEEGRALDAGVLKAAGTRAFVEAAPGEEFRYRNSPLRKMTAGGVRGRGRSRSALRLRPARHGGVTAGRASPERLPRAAGATVEDGVNGRTGIGGTRRLPRAEQPAFMVGSRSADYSAPTVIDRRDRMDGGSRDPNAGRDETPCGAGGVHGWQAERKWMNIVIGATTPRSAARSGVA